MAAIVGYRHNTAPPAMKMELEKKDEKPQVLHLVPLVSGVLPVVTKKKFDSLQHKPRVKLC